MLEIEAGIKDKPPGLETVSLSSTFCALHIKGVALT